MISIRPTALKSVLALAALAALPLHAAQAQSPIRPPATPLIVRDPYLSTWQPADSLPGTWPAFWTSGIRAITGIARIDGKSYVFLGAPGGGLTPMRQVSSDVTPTQSHYALLGGGVTVSLNFLSPVEPNDLRRLSEPLGYVFASAQSTDGKAHTVSLYFDISGEWASGDTSAPILWDRTTLTAGSKSAALTAFSVTPAYPRVLQEAGESATWGRAVWAAVNRPGLTTQSGPDADVRGTMLRTGVLTGAMDADQPRAINDRWPVFAFDFDLGTVRSTPTKPLTLVLGNVREPAVSYQGQPVPPLWRSYWPDWQHLLLFAGDDAYSAQFRAGVLDKKITAEATAAGGANYAALCALSLRQAFGATQMVGTAAKPWMFMKEISSSGNVCTVDVMYPSFPVFLYTQPRLLKMQLDPLLEYAESGLWPQPFAEHDLGASYPNADGHNDGGGENMPVEESANMLIMAAAYMRYAPKADAAAYAKLHYKILKQWADYLLTVPDGGVSPNALDPEYQNQTDDFTGSIAHSVNLALKGILGVGAMGQIAGFAGNTADSARYGASAKTMIGQWAALAQSPTGPHLMLQYIEPDTPRGAAWTTGRVGPYALSVSGGARAEVSVPVVDTTKSYTAAAWVRLANTNGYQTVLSIDGASVSGFFLQLRGDTGKFSLSALPADSTNSGGPAVASALDAPAIGAWYHLAGVYNAAAQTLSLYVNGVLQQTTPYTGAFRASGPTQIGCGLFNGHTDFVSGDIDDVRLYQSALSASDIQAALQGDGPATAGHWAFDEGTGNVSADLSGHGNPAMFAGNVLNPSEAWSLKYNAFPDKLLGLNLIPQSVLRDEAAFYKTQMTPFGVILDPRHTYTKADWELWTAASTDDPALRQQIVDGIYNFADTSSSRSPFTDWYDVGSGQATGFTARPVIGGLYALLARTALKPAAK